MLLALLFGTSSFANSADKNSVDAETALKWVKNGNRRFYEHHLRKDGDSLEDVKRLKSEQHPHTIVLSCSDSRVPPEIVFDQKLGEIFTVRSAGESPDENQIASIEYAIEHLGSRLLIVLGHTQCGAVKTALSSANDLAKETPAIQHLVSSIQGRLKLKSSERSAFLHDESFANAKGVVQDLLTKSKLVRESVANQKLLIRSALYRLDDGHVEWGE